MYIKSLPPIEAIHKIELYQIPSPYKEVLITACVHRKEGYLGCDFLRDNFKINLEYWTFGRRLKTALEMFRETNKLFCAPV